MVVHLTSICSIMVVWYGTILLEIIVYSTQWYLYCSSSLIILFPNVDIFFVLSHQRKFHIYGMVPYHHHTGTACAVTAMVC